MHAFARQSSGLGGTAGPRAVFRTLQWAIRFTAERWPCNKAELQQISRQGVARFMGVRTACLSLQVIAPTPQDLGLGVAAGSVEWRTLGLTNRASPMCLAQTCPQRFRGFVEACNRQQAEFATLMRDTPVSAGFRSLSERLGKLVGVIDHECSLGWGEDYVRPDIVRTGNVRSGS